MTIINVHIARVLKTLNPKLKSARTILTQVVNHLTMSYRRERAGNAKNAFPQLNKELNYRNTKNSKWNCPPQSLGLDLLCLKLIHTKDKLKMDGFNIPDIY